MKEKLIRFMYGRYGVDAFGKFLVILGCIMLVLSSFTRFRLAPVIAWAVIIYAYFRIFSKKIYKRSAENQAYLKYTAKIRNFWWNRKNLMKQRKTHHIYKCPSCRQKIRVPKGKGKIEIRCPKCQTTFIKRS